MNTVLSRRPLLLGLAAGAALGPARIAFARAAGDARLVVVLLRGALDGLAAMPPYGDPAYAALRPDAPREPGGPDGPLDLGGRFGLHPRLAALHAIYAANQAVVFHAISGPYRTRSHFDAQALLEGGAEGMSASGWLNRALAALPEDGATHAGLALGTEIPLLMRGPARVGNYAPPVTARPEADLLARIAALNDADPLLGPAMRDGLTQRDFNARTLGETGRAGRTPNPTAVLARAAGRLLAAPDGPRVAALDMGGWDTHVAQGQRLPGTLGQLDEALDGLREALGAAWARTAVLVMTEFGRTAAMNGSGGTDHGTGGVAFVLGGAIAGGRVIADWPGLAEGQLLERRDLAPTADLRGVAKALLRGHLGLPEQAVMAAFPGSAGVSEPAGLLRPTL
ncbi:DUF1501 domain-containing protein [Roseomonas hellenica]|uniref:DUF1501 domain-containing protein n=1 Tax=Plastoroseomonas hellenica TaxID=2687306 RepID=A0ABS5F3B7_9PROT|nr:DUF1501 domain-containing protein [Plastoroseomonas hellenica]MBR0666630.1 DUF1501 domain-containing protein [Plastoroseomonas hellenica]